ncbi:MAG: amino acid adenylation domain-containing protein, partial [Candidatus Aminicenantes bacterium]|nr:amino acid adenylation domain-containing protein [Candidatus Aminicenantes bacterium]
MSTTRLFSRLKEQGIILHLVEDNLKIAAPEGKLTAALLAEIKAQKSEIIEFLKKHIQKQEKFAAIEPAAERAYYPLSSAQERLYIVHHMMEENISYNMPAVMELIGPVEREKMEAVFRGLIERHESLRTSFAVIDEQPVQEIHSPEEIEFEIEYYDLEKKGDRQKDDLHSAPHVVKEAPESANENTPHHSSLIIHNSVLEFIRPFDLASAPLIRAGLIKIGEEKHLLMVDMHHIISDGTSIGILTGEFAALYGGQDLLSLKLQYKDYAAWQRSEEQIEAVKGQERFWLDRFAGELPLLNLPTDYPRPPVQDFKGDTLYFEIGKDRTKALKTLAAEEEVTLYMVLLSIYNIFLSKISGQEDVIVGTPTAGRRHADLHHIIGMFVNTLALRNYPAGNKTFRGFLNEVKNVTLAAFENQDYPFENLVDKIAVSRTTARNPLFDTMFALQNIDIPVEAMTALKMRPYKYEAGIAKFDLAIDIVEKGDILGAKIDYSTALFKRETVERFPVYFKETISSVSDAPDQELWQVDLLPEKAKERLLYDFNDTVVDYPRDRTIPELFDRQVEKTPENIAVVEIDVGEDGVESGPVSLTYRELNEESGHLAAVLIEKGVEPGTIVGIMVASSIEMITGLLGILKAGGAYLPIDPAYPKDRKQYILADSSAGLLLTTGSLSEKVDDLEMKEIKTVYIDSPVKVKDEVEAKMGTAALTTRGGTNRSPVSDLAYIIYTSGSTGRPKGVMVEHRGVVRLVKKPNFIDFQEGKRLLMTGALVFDITTLEIWGPLLNGLRLYLVGKEIIMDAGKLRDAVVNKKITILHLIPQLFNQFLEQCPDMFAGLEYFLVGGDLVKPGPVIKLRNMYDHIKILHCYGPTENTTFSTTFPVEKDYGERLPIGKPISNSSVYILNKYKKLQPIGIPGELYVGGDGLARGYLNNPQLTAEKFLSLSFDLDRSDKSEPITLYRTGEGAAHPPSKLTSGRSSNFTGHNLPITLYRTGDLACRLPDGNIEFLGRIDHQVKVRGVRIELGEIENRLIEQNEVKEAVVIAREDKTGDKYLCAYIVASSMEQGTVSGEDTDRGLSSSKLREYLSFRLPDYMAPSYFVFLERMPLNPNGKVDLKALPEPGLGESEVEYVAPRNEIEKKLVGIWSEILGLEKEIIGIDADFFQLGGHSLRATILTAKIHKKLAVKVPLVELFQKSTIRKLALFLETAVKERHFSIKVVEKKEYYPLSSAQNRFFILQQVTPGSAAYNMPMVNQIEGRLKKEKFETALREMIHRHESFRTSFRLIGNRPVQCVHDPADIEFKMDYFDLTGTSLAAGSLQSAAGIIRDFVRPFDLSKAPLLRLGLIKLAEARHVLLFDIHHIIGDGTSLNIFLQEFMILYGNGRLEPLPLQYRDFAQWQYDNLDAGKLREQENYWLERFSGEVPVLNMPTDFPRPSIQSFAGDKFDFVLEESLTADLYGLIKKTGTTLNIALLAVFNILLSRYSGQEDIIIGTTIFGRHHTDLQNIFGLLLETLAFRNYPRGERTFEQFFQEVKQAVLADFENQAYPFRELIKKLGAENEISRNPVFDAMLIIQNLEQTEFKLEGLQFSPYKPDDIELYDTSKLDFTLEAFETGEEIVFHLEYCTRLYKRQTMERFARHFINIIREVVREPGIRLAAIAVIDEEERERLLVEFNDTGPGTGVNKSRTIVQRFSDQVEKIPHRIAVLGACADVPGCVPGGEQRLAQLTYSALDEKSNRLALLLQEKGAEPDTIAAVLVEPFLEMPVALWGILKSGAAYLPIEPGTPADRISYMLEDSGARLLLTTRGVWEAVGSLENWPGEVIFIEQQAHHVGGDLAASRQANHAGGDLSYVIYTSGTTGRPKGVLVEHGNLSSYIAAFENEFDLGPEDTVIQQVSYAFDAFVEELYPILIKGGKLAIPGKAANRDLRALCNFIAAMRVTFITCSPQLLNEFDKVVGSLPPGTANPLSSLRILISGGDRLKGRYIENLRKKGAVYNTYGPTESTVCTTYYRCDPEGEVSDDVPIGKPISGYSVYIVDKYDNLLPIGVPGELCAAGPGVTRGYLNQPELTAGKFVQPDRTNKKNRSYTSYRTYTPYKSYRTGDLARWLADGNVEFLGRIDRQVNIRGFRIELAEIEAQLTALGNIKEAVVVERERKSGQDYLTAYVVCEGELDQTGVKNHLSRMLPDYMIPPYILAVEQIPLTPTGKIDHKRLPSPDAPVDRVYAAPGSEKEKILAGIWQEVLELERVGLDDNFFDIGGTSLDIFKVNTGIKEEFDREIPVVSMFRHTTVRSLVHLLEEGEEEGLPEAKRLEFAAALNEGKKIMKKRIGIEGPSPEELKPGTSSEAAAGMEMETAAVVPRTGLEIAVIGMAGIFPGSRNIDEFWQNLKNGVEGIAFFSEKELEAEGIDTETLKNPNYIKAKGIAADAEYFDSSFFGYTPMEAQLMDPQIRIFTQCVWHALEDAGYDPFSYNRRIGLYAGANPNLQWELITTFANVNRGLSGFMVAQLKDKDFMCTHISYKLDLKGPSYAVQTACSTSLVAVHMAVQSLLNGECEMALAGGAAVGIPKKNGYIYQEGMIFSADGHNRTFDAAAKGSVFSDGVGAVVLKRLRDAIADRDNIYAVVKGSATNNDGIRKIGYTAPSIDGQAEVIKTAQLMAEVEPESITYIEAHGTATPLGDTVEIEALKKAFNTEKKGFCAVGTVKSNIGHLYSAAGAAGFIKTVLALKQRLIPPTLHFNTPNPQIDFENSPFYVVSELTEWKSKSLEAAHAAGPLRAGVSAFGIGGTNAHVVLEEFAGPVTGSEVEHSRKLKLLALSARTGPELNRLTDNLINYLLENPGIDFADAAYTLQVGRKHLPYRKMAVLPAPDLKEKEEAEKLSPVAKRTAVVFNKEEHRPVYFMICGQGSQYVNMGIDLYRSEAVFRKEIDRCFEILEPLTGYDLKEVLYPEEKGTSKKEHKLNKSFDQ